MLLWPEGSLSITTLQHFAHFSNILTSPFSNNQYIRHNVILCLESFQKIFLLIFHLRFFIYLQLTHGIFKILKTKKCIFNHAVVWGKRDKRIEFQLPKFFWFTTIFCRICTSPPPKKFYSQRFIQSWFSLNRVMFEWVWRSQLSRTRGQAICVTEVLSIVAKYIW